MIKIKELKECIELCSEELEEFESYKVYIGIKQEEIISVKESFIDIISKGQQPQNVEIWEEDDILIAKDIIKNPADYKDLPQNGFVDEEEITAEFISNYKNEKLKKQLMKSFKKSMRNFKQDLYEEKIHDEYYNYYDGYLEKKIFKWCESNKINFVTK